MLHIALHAFRLGPIVGGAILLFAPTFVLELITSEEWEIGLLRYLGMVSVALGLLWEVRGSGADFSRPARRRARAGWVLLVVYLFSTAGFFLFIGFSLLTAAMLEIALGRAIAYSEALRRQIDPPRPPPP